MILEFDKHEYINVDAIIALRWIEREEQGGFGVIVFNGSKITTQTREKFDAVEQAFINLHKSYMYDNEQKKIIWKRGKR